MPRLTDLFYNSANKYPGKQAIWCDGNSMTYDQLSTSVSQCANFLSQNGIKYKDHIGIPMNNSIESVVLILAAAEIGAGLVPINPTIPYPAIEAAFNTGNVEHIIARKAFYKQVEKANGNLPNGLKLCLDGEFKDILPFSDINTAPANRTQDKRITGDETLFLTMTSGSTGKPKPINLTQNNKYERAMAHIKLYDITENDRILAATPLYHSLAERLVLLPLLIGATSILLPRFTPSIWLNCVYEQKVTFTIAVTAQLSQIAQLLSSPFIPDISSLRSIVSSSALLEPHVRTELIDKLKCDFHEMYGTSETSTATSINFRESINKQKSVGRAIPQADIRIIREDESIAKTNEIGEIVCKTKLMFDGYYNMPKLTQSAFTDGYFKTGDLGRLDEDGYLYFCGRKKELIITGGINVYPQDVEQCVQQIPGIDECAAFSYPDDRLGEVVALAVVLSQGADTTKRMIQTHCARNLADFQQPHHIFILQSLPKNAMGKLMKSKIIEQVRIDEITNK